MISSLPWLTLCNPRGGAACTLSAAWAIAKLQIPVNLVLCIPLTENMPSGKATKPGDIVVASNGVTIEVDNTDAEGKQGSRPHNLTRKDLD